jgi:hypothetical protein
MECDTVKYCVGQLPVFNLYFCCCVCSHPPGCCGSCISLRLGLYGAELLRAPSDREVLHLRAEEREKLRAPETSSKRTRRMVVAVDARPVFLVDN